MLKIGEELHGRYRIEALLGEGGMGAVYRAYDWLEKRMVAVKEFRLGDLPSKTKPPIKDKPVMRKDSQPPTSEGTIHRSQKQSLVTGEVIRRTPTASPEYFLPLQHSQSQPLTREQALEQFRQEAELLKKLNHPNLPQVFDFFTYRNQGYIIMTLVEGGDLYALFERKDHSLDEQQVRSWLFQILDALKHCHAHGVVHRDIKPENLLLTPEGRIYLVDFGIAKSVSSGATTTVFAAHALSPGFSPPEQYGGQGGTDARSDIYSLGAVLYFLLTGSVPPEAMERASGKLLVAPGKINPNISNRMQIVIRNCLELNKENRPQSVQEIERMLEEEPVLPPKMLPKFSLKWLAIPSALVLILTAFLVIRGVIGGEVDDPTPTGTPQVESSMTLSVIGESSSTFFPTSTVTKQTVIPSMTRTLSRTPTTTLTLTRTSTLLHTSTPTKTLILTTLIIPTATRVLSTSILPTATPPTPIPPTSIPPTSIPPTSIPPTPIPPTPIPPTPIPPTEPPVEATPTIIPP